MSKMRRKEKMKPDIPERNPCFTGDFIKKDRTYKFCDDEVKTPFSWWCEPTKEGGYQFLEERPSFSAERYYRVPWQPEFAERRDDTWPFNCDPLRCANFKRPRCLKKILYGDNVCYKKPCGKYRLKAPLFYLPENLGQLPACRTCCYTRACRGKPKVEYRCGIHCGQCVEEEVECSDQAPLNQQKDCQCSIPTTNLSVQTTKTTFKDCSCDPPSQSSEEDDIHCPSFELFPNVDSAREVTCDNHLLEVSYSCPTKTRTGSFPVCLIKEAFKDYRSCQDLMNERRNKTALEEGAISNQFLKYLRCFDLEKDTLEYIQKCASESQNDSKPAPSNRSSSTKVLFRKLVDEKFENIASILEISDNMKDVIGKDDLFSMLVNASLPENITEDLKLLYKKLLMDKLERLNTVLQMTDRMKTAEDRREILALVDESEAELLEGSINTTLTNLNRKLFIDKLARINSILELTEKMKTAKNANDIEAILSCQLCCNDRKSDKKGRKTNEKRVNTLFEGRKNVRNESSEMNPTYLTPSLQVQQPTSNIICPPVGSQRKKNVEFKLFRKLVDEKFDNIASLLEISDNMKDVIGEDDLFSMLVNASLPENITEDLKLRYKNLLLDKLERLNTVLKTTERMKTAEDRREILALVDESEAEPMEGSINTILTNLNRKLFIDKLTRINSILELTEKMKTAKNASDIEAILSCQLCCNDRESDKKGVKINKKRVNTLFEERKNVWNESSEMNPTYLTPSLQVQQPSGNIICPPIGSHRKKNVEFKLFRKLVDEKFDNIASILEISDNMKEVIGKDDLFSMLVNASLPENFTEDLKLRYKNLLLDKLERLNTVLRMTERMKTAEDRREILALVDESEAEPMEGSINTILTNLNRKLFIDKLARINSILELTEKMKAANNADDIEAILYNQFGSTDRKTNRRVVKINGNQQKALTKTCKSKISGEIYRSDSPDTVIKIDVGVRGEDVEVLKTSVESKTVPSAAICKNYKPTPHSPCPSSYFEIENYLKGLKALVTTYDPFLSPYSPRRDEIYARKMHVPKRMVSTKKCFPMLHNVRYVKTQTSAVVRVVEKPVSVLPGERVEAMYKQPVRRRDIVNEMKKWRVNWTGRRMSYCSNETRKKCPYGIH